MNLILLFCLKFLFVFEISIEFLVFNDLIIFSVSKVEAYWQFILVKGLLNVYTKLLIGLDEFELIYRDIGLSDFIRVQ